MKEVVITGAAGFIGRALTERLIHEGVKVYAIDLEVAHDRIVKSDLVTPLAIDFNDARELSELIRIAQPDVLYHLAWSGVSTDVKNDVQRQTSNISVSLAVLEACAQAGCKNIVIPGSSSEYAYFGEIVNGANVPAPGDAYAAAKAAAQVLCQWYAKTHELNLNWLLIGSIYGPGRNDSNVLTYTIRSLLQGEDTAYSKLEQLWDYIYIDDLIEAMYLVGLHGKGGTYPVGYGEAKPLASYLEAVRDMIDPNAALGIGKMPYKFGSKPDNSVLDITRLKEDTDFTPQVSFEEGIRRTIDYFRRMEQ